MADIKNMKNKWYNQRIHKKYNLIQYSSKHYGTAPHSIISKAKSPVKQRKDRKKFKAQRKRKTVYKQMAFDFDDFIYKNKNENTAHQVKIRPAIQYSYNQQDKYKIDKCYYDYYFNDNPKNLYENYLHWSNFW
eukprot:328761_1